MKEIQNDSNKSIKNLDRIQDTDFDDFDLNFKAINSGLGINETQKDLVTSNSLEVSTLKFEEVSKDSLAPQTEIDIDINLNKQYKKNMGDLSVFYSNENCKGNQE